MYDLKPLIKTILDLTFKTEKWKSKLIELAYKVNKSSSTKVYLRPIICNKCKINVSIINNRTDCKCKRMCNLNRN